MTDHETAAPSLLLISGAFIKRPGMFLGTPIRYDRVTAFISGYTLAIDQARDALSRHTAEDFRAVGIEGQFQQQLRDEGRLRWDRWDLTIAAEAIDWTHEEPPVVGDFTEEQHRAAIAHLQPLLERMFALPNSFTLGSGDEA